jgi:hypothetical protein
MNTSDEPAAWNLRVLRWMQMFPSKVGTTLPNNIIYNDIPEDSIHHNHHCENLKFRNVRIWNFTTWELEIWVTYEQNNNHRNNHSQKTLLVFKPSIYRMQSLYYPMSWTEFCVMYCMAAEHMQSVIISTHLMLADLKLSATWKFSLKKASRDRGFSYVLFIFKAVTLLI